MDRELGLSKDEEVLNQGKWVNDSLIDAGQKLLKQAFGDKIEGLQDLCLTQTLVLNVCSGEFVQVLNKGDCHWYTILTIGCQHVDSTSCIYDQQQMRKHFWHCLTNRTMQVFPLHLKRQIMPQPVKVENFAVYCHCRLPWDRHHAHDDMTMCTVCRE